MSLEDRLVEVVSAIGADVKSINATLANYGLEPPPAPEPTTPESARGVVNVTIANPTPWTVDAPDWVIYPVPNSTTAPTAVGGTVTGVGTLTAGSLSTTNGQTRSARSIYRVTTAAVGTIASVRQGAQTIGPIRNDGWGGFRCSLSSGPDTGTSIAGDLFFMGLRGSNTTPTNVAPSSLTSIVGLGYDSTDTNLQIMHNDASGTATKVDTTWPIPTTDSSAFYELDLYSSPVDGTVKYRATRVDPTGRTVITGVISTDLPSNTTWLQFFAYHSTGTVSSVVGLALGNCRGNNSLV